MKKFLVPIALVAMLVCSVAKGDLVITGVLDGPLPGGLPKAIEFYAQDDIADLSVYTIQTYSNGGTTAQGTTTTLTAGSLAAGSFYYLTNDAVGFSDFMGFAANEVGASNINNNGDDVYELLNGAVTADVYGVIGQDGTGQSWEFLDGWAYRKDNTGPSPTFNDADWNFSGINVFDGQTTNDTSPTPFPAGTYSFNAVPEPGSMALIGLFGITALLRRRK